MIASSSVVNISDNHSVAHIFDIPIAAVRRHELTKSFEELLTSGKRGWVSYVNIHAMNLAAALPWFKAYLQDSLLVYCDGEGVKLGARILGQDIPERVVFSDWIDDVCQVAAKHRLGVYLLGGREDVASVAATRLVARIPGLIIAGTHHGYSSVTNTEQLVKTINSSGARILIVGMGMPLQEAWIVAQSKALAPNIILNAGSCFDYVAGAKKRCPAWMGRMGMEWAYRLIQEPRRLWRRYLIGNPRFFIRILAAARSRFIDQRHPQDHS